MTNASSAASRVSASVSTPSGPARTSSGCGAPARRHDSPNASPGRRTPETTARRRSEQSPLEPNVTGRPARATRVASARRSAANADATSDGFEGSAFVGFVGFASFDWPRVSSVLSVLSVLSVSSSVSVSFNVSVTSVLRISAAPRMITNIARLSSRSSPLVITGAPEAYDRTTYPPLSARTRVSRGDIASNTGARASVDAWTRSSSDPRAKRRDATSPSFASRGFHSDAFIVARRSSFTSNAEKTASPTSRLDFEASKSREFSTPAPPSPGPPSSGAATPPRDAAPGQKTETLRRRAIPSPRPFAFPSTPHASRAPGDQSSHSESSTPTLSRKSRLSACVRGVRPRTRRQHATRARTELGSGFGAERRGRASRGCPRLLVVEEEQALERAESADGGWPYAAVDYFSGRRGRGCSRATSIDPTRVRRSRRGSRAPSPFEASEATPRRRPTRPTSSGD